MPRPDILDNPPAFSWDQVDWVLAQVETMTADVFKSSGSETIAAQVHKAKGATLIADRMSAISAEQNGERR